MTRTVTHRSTFDRRRSRRQGFTLIELLSVIGIITILITLVTFASVRFITTSRAAATRVTIAKATEVLNVRRKALGRLLADTRGARSPALRTLATIGQDAEFRNGRVTPRGVKEAVAAFFPVTVAEIAASPAYSGLSPLPDDEEEVLYFLLTQGEKFGVDEVDTEFTAAEVRSNEAGTTAADTFPMLVDSWGNPIRFYRWPTSLMQDPPLDQAGNNGDSGVAIRIRDTLSATSDPDDPLVELTQADRDAYHGEAYHTFLLVSPGPDGTLGITEPVADTPVRNGGPNRVGLAAVLPTGFEAGYDDLSNLNTSAGGSIE
ncbi:MAG: prepilin-type N-terminal cleavage/methylation domain-containing protein [Planctomycetota bacterium]